MSDTKSLLTRITAFRERLEKTPPLVGGAGVDPSAVVERVARTALQPGWVGSALRQLGGKPGETGLATAERLTGRAKRLLESARELVAKQREITDDVFFARISTGHSAGSPDPLVDYHRFTVSATESTLRVAAAMPDSAELQLRMCDGLEAMLTAIGDRLAIGGRALELRRREWGRVERLARLLCDLQARRLVSAASFAGIAEELVAEARHGVPLRFVTAPGEPVARFVAAHALTVGQVVARLAAHDFEWTSQQVPAVAAALMMDVGMLTVPADVVGKPMAFDDADRRLVEPHPTAGAALLREVMPEVNGPIAAAIAAHHERLDGTGYPVGLKGDEIPSLARLLAAADVYAGMATDRPHRPAHDTRAALADTLMEAENGRLDADMAELLVRLSFHPVGTVVELTDGRTAVVVSTHTGKVNVRATTRPVVAVLADAAGVLLPKPEFIDLAGAEYGGVVRALGTAERKRVLAAAHPDLC
jgi:HD-GYP domain-containing protein (c-di-GMP phosphodiesterase class II)